MQEIIRIFAHFRWWRIKVTLKRTCVLSYRMWGNRSGHRAGSHSHGYRANGPVLCISAASSFPDVLSMCTTEQGSWDSVTQVRICREIASRPSDFRSCRFLFRTWPLEFSSRLQISQRKTGCRLISLWSHISYGVTLQHKALYFIWKYYV